MDDPVVMEPLEGPGRVPAEASNLSRRQAGPPDSVPEVAAGHQLEHQGGGSLDHPGAPHQAVAAAEFAEQSPFRGEPEALVRRRQVGHQDLEGNESAPLAWGGAPDFRRPATGREAADQLITGDYHPGQACRNLIRETSATVISSPSSSG